MLKIKSLKFSGIGRFIDSQEVNFESLSQLIQIDGQNENTGGSSGAGKSTIFQALSWLLGLDSLPTTILQSRLTKDHISVEGFFDWDGKIVKIKRAKKLSIEIDSEEFSGSSKIVEEKLDQVLGLSRNLFSKMLYRKQNESGFFLQFSPAQMNQFLTDCLGLNSIRSKIDSIEQKIKDLSQLKIQDKMQLEAAKAALQATIEATQSLGPEPIIEISKEDIEKFNQNTLLAKTALDYCLFTHEIEKKALDERRPIIEVKAFDFTNLNALNSQIKDVENQINLVIQKDKNRQEEVKRSISNIKSETNNTISRLKLEHQNKLSELKGTLMHLNGIIQSGNASKETAVKLYAKIKEQKAGICHVCKQSWITHEARSEEERLSKELMSHRENIEGSTVASKEFESLKVITVTLNEELNKEINKLNENSNLQIQELTKQLAPIISPELPDLNEKLADVCQLKLEEYDKEKQFNLTQNESNQKILQDYFLEQKTLSDKQQEIHKALKDEFDSENRKYQEAQIKFNSHVKVLEDYKRTLFSLDKKKEEINQKVAHMDLKLSETEESLLIAEEAKRCLKSYLSCSFDDALDSISDSATRILRSVPTMANATIRLVGTKETGAGAIKEQINALIDNDGEENIPIKSLSGGERSAVDMAIDLAVTSLIQEKSNIGCDLMCLDEVFGGFDSVGIEQALEMLRTFTDKRILIVEHNSIGKELIPSRITVVRNGEVSQVKTA